MSQPNYYAIIPAIVRYDKRLKPSAKLLYGEITSLTQRDGYCWADNSYFAELYGVDTSTISRWISQLSSYDYIEVELLKSEGNKRKITIDKKVNTYMQKSQEVLTKKSIAIDKKVKSIYENNKINNKKNKESTSLAFLEVNFPSAFEVLMMQYKSRITDFVKFSEMFEATVQMEKLEYDLDVISGRFKKFARNWIDNQSKYEVRSVEVVQLNKKIGKPA
jgi:hypothetical protein